jgi:hypothetical protein
MNTPLPMGRPPLPDALWRERYEAIAQHLLAAEACAKLAAASLGVKYDTLMRWAHEFGFCRMWVSREERRYLLERRRHRRRAGQPVETELQRTPRAA